MTPERAAAQAFRDVLVEIARLPPECDSETLSALNARFRRALLAFGSDTEENRRCVEHLDIGPVGPIGASDPAAPSDAVTESSQSASSDPTVPRRSALGLRVNGTAALADVYYHIESGPISSTAEAAFPDLTEESWDAARRFVTLMLLALQTEPP